MGLEYFLTDIKNTKREGEPEMGMMKEIIKVMIGWTYWMKGIVEVDKNLWITKAIIMTLTNYYVICSYYHYFLKYV